MIIVVFTALLSALSCGVYLLLARRWRLLDHPNARSSHVRPTPHGGGLPLLLAFAAGLALAAPYYGAWSKPYLALAAGGLSLLALGVLDDLRGLSIRLRFVLYSLCAALVAVYLLQPLWRGAAAAHSLLVAAWALAILWSLNLYNFMDGIDGLAALQCVLACGGAALLSWQAGGSGSYILFCLLLASAHLGFLVWNWPMARLFMGDAGSVPSGFLLAGLALLGAVQGQLQPACWLVLLGLFVVDASCTLAWRLLGGQDVTRAHRAHAYQRLARHWGSHLKVDLLCLAVNALWLLPLARAVQIWPEQTLILVILAYVPLLLGMVKVRGLA
ncbi:MAG: glycosyl transferase family 4 [Halioglobus sp.]|nr:glycosyl transferase family 4 [Halioglobus sp.]